MIADEKLALLPKWARQHIARLNGEIADLKSDLSEIESEDTLVRWRVPGKSGSHRLPGYAKIHLKTKQDEIIVSLFDGMVRVSAWNGQLVIVPVASNCVNVYSKR